MYLVDKSFGLGAEDARLLCSVLLSDVDEKVDHTLGVAPLIVVPRDELDEVSVQGDSSLRVES